jgi:segregation and condensation protein A
MDSPVVSAGAEAARPAVVLPSFEGPLDLLLHLVRENRVSIWDIPVALICDQYHTMLRRMEALDLEVAGEYLVYAAWLLAIKSRMLLPRRRDDASDPREELVERLLEYTRIKEAAAELGGLAELRRGMAPVAIAGPLPPDEAVLELEDLDILTLARTMAEVLERHRRDHPASLELAPIRFSVRDTMVQLHGLLLEQRTFPLLSYLLTRSERVESVTCLIAGLELVRLRAAKIHQRHPFSEIYLRATGNPLPAEEAADA